MGNSPTNAQQQQLDKDKKQEIEVSKSQNSSNLTDIIKEKYFDTVTSDLSKPKLVRQTCYKTDINIPQWALDDFIAQSKDVPKPENVACTIPKWAQDEYVKKTTE